MNLVDSKNGIFDPKLYDNALLGMEVKVNDEEKSEVEEKELSQSEENSSSVKEKSEESQVEERRREVEAQALLLHYPKDGTEKHKEFLLQILKGTVNKIFIESYKNVYLKDHEISEEELAQLLIQFYLIVVLTTEEQKPQLFSEYVQAVESSADRLKALKNCLHLDYTDEEFHQVLKKRRFLTLPPNARLTITHIESQEWTQLAETAKKEANGLSWQDVTGFLQKRIERENTERLNIRFQGGHVSYFLNEKNHSFSIQWSAILQLSITTLKTCSLEEMIKETNSQKDKIFIFDPNSEVTFTGLQKEQIEMITQAESTMSENSKETSKIHAFRELIMKVSTQNVLLIINGACEVNPLIKEQSLTLEFSKGGSLHLDHPITFNNRSGFAAGVVIVDAPIGFNLGNIHVNIVS